MLLLAGTIPCNVGQIITGRVDYKEGCLQVGKNQLPVNRGTAALISAAAICCRHFNVELPYAILAGDIGQKTSGALIYEALQDFLKKNSVKVLALHYLMPNILYHKKLMVTIQKLNPKPILIADAGAMYVAKSAGQATQYDLFTPDLGELAYLADDKASHPAYTRGFICELEEEVPSLIKRAYQYQNAATYLCVKGCTDYVCYNGEIVKHVDYPDVEVLEAIGGTGDTLSGIAAALIYKDVSIDKACFLAARVNRWAGKLTDPTPATQIGEILQQIPAALREVQEKQ